MPARPTPEWGDERVARRPVQVGYFDMMILEENARLIATDSGGVQREAYFLGVPCLTLRDETEWQETVTAGWNRLVGVQAERVLAEWATFAPPAMQPPIFGDGTAGERIARNIIESPVVFGAAVAPIAVGVQV